MRCALSGRRARRSLPNRGVLFGVETMAELLDMGQEADESGAVQSVWGGGLDPREAATRIGRAPVGARGADEAGAPGGRVHDIWVAYGSPEEVVGKKRDFADAGAKEITLRITSFDQRRQDKRLIGEVLRAFEPAGVA
jgi:hypothetical protein